MTREEAIEMLKSKMDGNTDTSYEWAETVRMAIKALEQEPCEDCVSRKALIERINHAEENFKADNMESIGSDDGDPFVDGVLSGVFNIREMVIQAPSVTLQEPFKPIVEIDLYSVIKRKYIEREVLDKIRAEISEYGSIWVTYTIKDTSTKGIEKLVEDVLKQAKEQVIDVIDKYKAESEDKE